MWYENRWLVCGGRSFVDIRGGRDRPDFRDRLAERNCITDTLSNLAVERGAYGEEFELQPLPRVTIIAGAATGADACAVDWARNYGCTYREFPANWELHGKAAGMIRNAQMLKEGKPDLVIAFPGGRGTAGMVNLAKRAGVETIIVPYEKA